MSISSRVAKGMERASWIRRMFEEGVELRKIHGADAVLDLSLGNPDLEPPAEFRAALAEIARDETPGTHRYMANAGLPEAREAVAAMIAREQRVDPRPEGVLMTTGAAGALNVILKSVLDPGCEVLTPSPFFPEYEFYADNHQGTLVPVRTREDFSLDLDALARALGPKTRAIILNSPNNPTGRVYPRSDVDALGKLLDEKAPQATLVSDEPYRKLAWDGITVPSVLEATKRSAVASSFSKDLGLAGERIGFLAIHPEHPDRAQLLAAATFSLRTLGFVNAPALQQRIVTRLVRARADLEQYRKKRDLALSGLLRAGYRCVKPEGGMFLFPEAPGRDDIEFARRLARTQRILVVPGTGFGAPGFFRVSLAVPTSVIERSLAGFERALAPA